MTILNLVIRFFDNNTLLLYRALLAQRFAWVLKISLSLPLAALKDLFHLAFQQTVSSSFKPSISASVRSGLQGRAALLRVDFYFYLHHPKMSHFKYNL